MAINLIFNLHQKYYNPSQLQKVKTVIPAKAGIQSFQELIWTPAIFARGVTPFFEFYNSSIIIYISSRYNRLYLRG